jgi:hypothetical protein
MKKRLIYLFVFFTIAYVARGWVFRQIVQYRSIGERVAYPITDPVLLKLVTQEHDRVALSGVEDLIEISHKITSEQVSFTESKCDTDPNRLVHTHKANCIGYAALFSTLFNAFVKMNMTDRNWSAHPQKGQLYFLGINVHPYFDRPFFRDHDFVLLQNTMTGELIAVDPSLYDYSGIKYVTFR